ncbi:hypothetical protein BB987_01795 [Photorhabdus temperata]|uniref:ATP-grasp domain-containing protein n=1 Tax=Photorhabdus khanii NC19 TaxID=1004151 RepID=W3V463_9GAMM|nr:hypothetical protein [Photorhabdus khanii]ETS30622.1 hypothetical protein PTE_02567 [Photorhabdus khanii NC19]OHV54096.1 hypothetical protein BB987_01795 [Photorhabdus temperata]
MDKVYWIVAEEEHPDAEDIESSYSEYTREFHKRGIEFRFLPLRDCVIHFDNEGSGKLLHRGKHLDDNQSAFIISPADLNPQAKGTAFSLRNYLRITGTRLLNESIGGVENLEWDKVAQMMLVSGMSAPLMPFCMLGYHQQVVPSVRSFLDKGYNTLIFKPIGSGMGFGVIKTVGHQQAISTANLISASSVVYFVMPFLEKACDVRFYFLAGDLMFVKIRKPRQADYLGNVALGGEQDILSKDEYTAFYCSQSDKYEEMLELSTRIVDRTGNDILSVDWLMTGECFYFNEMCTAETGLTKLPDHIKTPVFDKMAFLVKERLNK